MAALAFSLVGLVDGFGDQPVSGDRDYMWRRWTVLDDHQAAVGVVAVIGMAVASTILSRARTDGRLLAPALAQVVVLSLFAAWLGAGYHVVTDGVTGANIGGGLVLLITPVFAVSTLAVVAGLSLRSRLRQARPSDDS